MTTIPLSPTTTIAYPGTRLYHEDAPITATPPNVSNERILDVSLGKRILAGKPALPKRPWTIHSIHSLHFRTKSFTPTPHSLRNSKSVNSSANDKCSSIHNPTMSRGAPGRNNPIPGRMLPNVVANPTAAEDFPDPLIG